MKALLCPIEYHCDKVFDEEQNKIFGSTWQFVAYVQEVESDGDFISVEIAGKSVVIKNFGGKLKAFRNVCSHRFSRICNGQGNGPLQCPYHGWTYNELGEPYAIPGFKNFDSLDKSKLKLSEYQLESSGKFIFVNLSSNTEPLSEYLGDMWEPLCELSPALGEKLDHNEMVIDANWKVCVENTLEAYHVYQVHPESFHTLGVESHSFSMCKNHSSDSMELSVAIDDSSLKATFDGRPLKIKGYKHFFIFPNLTIATAFGTTISVQRFIPINANQTRFVSEVFATTGVRASSVVKALNTSAVDFNRRVFNEDKVVCEQVQLGLREMFKQKGPLSMEEARVISFQKSYQKIMLAESTRRHEGETIYA